MRPAIPPPGSPRASGAVTSSASPRPTRTRRASKAVTAAAIPAPLRSTPSASGRETRRHFVPSRSLLGRSRRSAPLPSSRVRRTCHGPCFVLAALGHVPRQVLRGRRCRTSSTRQRASHPRGFAARPIPDADARLRRCHTSCEALPTVRTCSARSAACAPAAPALRTRNRGSQCDAPSPLPKAMNRASRAVTVHAHTLRPCHALCEPHRW